MSFLLTRIVYSYPQGSRLSCVQAFGTVYVCYANFTCVAMQVWSLGWTVVKRRLTIRVSADERRRSDYSVKVAASTIPIRVLEVRTSCTLYVTLTLNLRRTVPVGTTVKASDLLSRLCKWPVQASYCSARAFLPSALVFPARRCP